MGFVAIFLFAVPFAAALLISWHRSLGPFRNSALNPMLLFAAYTLLIGADFAAFGFQHGGVLAQHRLSTTPSILLVLEIKFVSMLLAALLGITTAFFVSAGARPAEHKARSVGVRTPLMVLYLAVLGAWLFGLLSLGIDVASLADTVEVKSHSAGVAALFIPSMLLLPALAYALAKQPFKVVLPVVAISIVVLLASGSRSRILYVVVPFVFYLFRIRSIPLPRIFFAGGVVLTIVLSVIALNIRTLASYTGGRAATLEVTDLSQLFNSNDVAFAEVNLALSRLKPTQLQNYLGEDLLGFTLAIVPRAIVPFKPNVGSRQFTEVYDPFRLAKFNRLLTTGGFSEIEYDYPFPLALVVMYVLSAAWGAGFVRAANSRTLHGFAWTVALYIGLHLFFRADLQETGQILWSFVLYWLVVRGLQAMVTRGAPPPPSNRPARVRPALMPSDAGG